MHRQLVMIPSSASQLVTLPLGEQIAPAIKLQEFHAQAGRTMLASSERANTATSAPSWKHLFIVSPSCQEIAAPSGAASQSIWCR
jgi:hypothetical protein